MQQSGCRKANRVGILFNFISTMKNLKLNKLAENRLNEKEMNSINGGAGWYITCGSGYCYSCGCACAYANSGGSSDDGNGWANSKSNLASPGMRQ